MALNCFRDSGLSARAGAQVGCCHVPPE